MSEKGQGEESNQGAATATDAGSAIAGVSSGGGGQADQTGPGGAGTVAVDQGDSVADDIEKAAEAVRATEAEAERTLDDLKGAAEDAKEALGDEKEADTKPTQEELDAAEERRQKGYDDAMRRRDEERAREEGPPVEPPDLSDDSKGSDDKPAGSYMGDDEKPVLS